MMLGRENRDKRRDELHESGQNIMVTVTFQLVHGGRRLLMLRLCRLRLLLGGMLMVGSRGWRRRRRRRARRRLRRVEFNVLKLAEP